MANNQKRSDSDTKIVKKPESKFDKILVIDVIWGMAVLIGFVYFAYHFWLAHSY